MSGSRSSKTPHFFESAAAFRKWLKEFGESERELIVGFHKVGSGRPSMTWPESVDEALSYGWIDGVRTRIDEHSYKIRFTPRRKNSVWSAVNIARAESLIANGRMAPPGLAAYARRTERRSRVYSYEQGDEPEFTGAELRRFRKQSAAWEYFQNAPPSYRKTVTRWVTSAKRSATRARRLSELIDACTRQTRLLK